MQWSLPGRWRPRWDLRNGWKKLVPPDPLSARLLIYMPLGLLAALLIATSPAVLPSSSWAQGHPGTPWAVGLGSVLLLAALLDGLRRRHLWDLVAAPVSVVVSLLMVMTVILPVTAARQRGLLEGCKRNLAGIARSLDLYAQANEGRYPDSLQRLTKGSPPFLVAIPSCPAVSSDSYSRGYMRAVAARPADGRPEVYTVCCRSMSHDLCDILPGFPQYSSSAGLINNPIFSLPQSNQTALGGVPPSPMAGSAGSAPPPGTMIPNPNGKPLFMGVPPPPGSIPPPGGSMPGPGGSMPPAGSVPSAVSPAGGPPAFAPPASAAPDRH